MVNNNLKNAYIISQIEDNFEEVLGINFLAQEVSLAKNKHAKSSIQISPIEGRILQLLIKMNNIKKIVEIGTFIGRSTMWMANALPFKGIIYSIEKDFKAAQIAKENFETYRRFNIDNNINSNINNNNIELIIGPAKEKLDELALLNSRGKKEIFDMVFIDANKAGYLEYLNWAEFNIRTGGLIVADNTLAFNGLEIFNCPIAEKGKKGELWEVIHLFNKRLADSRKYDSIIIPTEKGLTVAIKKF